MEELRVEDPQSLSSSTTSGWSLSCMMSWCREWGQMDREAGYEHEEGATQTGLKLTITVRLAISILP